MGEGVGDGVGLGVGGGVYCCPPCWPRELSEFSSDASFPWLLGVAASDRGDSLLPLALFGEVIVFWFEFWLD